MEVISYRQSVFLLSMILPVTGHMLLLPPMYNLSGHNAWVTILLAVPIGFLFSFILYRLHTLHPDKTFMEMAEVAFGRWGGKAISLGLLLYFFYMLIITFYSLYDFIQINFLLEIYRWVIAVAFYAVVLYAVFVGIESVARTSAPLFLIITITGTAIGVATHEEKNYEILFPIFDTGWMPILYGVWITAALFGEMAILTMLKMKKDYAKSKSLLFTTNVLVILITFMFLGTVVSALTIFGEEQAKNLSFPAQSVTRIVTFGFIERYDVYGIFTMVVGCVIRMATFQIIFNHGIRQLMGVSKKGKLWVHLGIVVAILGSTLFGIRNHRVFFDFFMTTLYPLSAILSLGLPMLLWIVLEWKKRSQKKKQASTTVS